MLDIVKFSIVDQIKVCQWFAVYSEYAGRFEEVHLWNDVKAGRWTVDLCEVDFIALRTRFPREEDARGFIKNMLDNGAICEL